MAQDQFARWRHAMAGNRIETERGNPASGFYKSNAGDGRVEVIAIWRDDDGAGPLQCARTVYGDGSRMDADAIDELFGSVCLYPISEDAFNAVYERGETLPPEYATKLTLKDQAAGVCWTPEYGRKRLGLDLHNQPQDMREIMRAPAEATETAQETPPAGIGHNMPPEPVEPVSEAPTGHTVDGEQTPDKVLFAEISGVSAAVKSLLDGYGGKPRSKSETDLISDYATKFKSLEKKGDDAHAQEKRPILDAGKAIDARWKRPRDMAVSGRKRCLEIVKAYDDAESARLADEARRQNEEAARVAAQTGTEAPPPVEPIKQTYGNTRTVAMRERPVWHVDDPKAFGSYLLGLDPISSDLLDVLRTIAQRIGSAGVSAPGISRTTVRSAA